MNSSRKPKGATDGGMAWCGNKIAITFCSARGSSADARCGYPGRRGVCRTKL